MLHCVEPSSEVDSALNDLIRLYERERQPVSINFRSLVRLPGYPDRGTHLLHPYPAKLLAHIPYFFLNSKQISPPGTRAHDPFCGSGTVLVEALLAGHKSLGIDVNPLAVLISKVKTTRLNDRDVLRATQAISDVYPRDPVRPAPDVINIDHWFPVSTKLQLHRLWEAIDSLPESPERDFLRLCFSSVVRRTSLADPRVSVPVRLKHNQYPPEHWLRAKTNQLLDRLSQVDVKLVFDGLVQANLNRLNAFWPMIDPAASTDVHLHDTRHPNPSAFPKVDLILTSPPYAGAQKYVRASSLSLGWLSLCASADLKHLESRTIGREHYRKADCRETRATGLGQADALLEQAFNVNPLRAQIAATYLIEMQQTLDNCFQCLNPGGHLVLVIGNSSVCGLEFMTSTYLKDYLQSLGLTLQLELLDDIRSRGLMTKRNRNASVISRESVMVFKK